MTNYLVRYSNYSLDTTEGDEALGERIQALGNEVVSVSPELHLSEVHLNFMACDYGYRN